MKTVIPGVVDTVGTPGRMNAFAGGLGRQAPKGHAVSLRRVRQQAQALSPDPGVRQIQKALNKELALSLKVNGLFDPATKDAHRRWQPKPGFTGAELTESPAHSP